jgi:hypothetical protein
VKRQYIKETLYIEVAKTYGENKSLMHEIMKKEKEICISFAPMPQTAKIMAVVHKCLIMMEEALNLWVEETCSD